MYSYTVTIIILVVLFLSTFFTLFGNFRGSNLQKTKALLHRGGGMRIPTYTTQITNSIKGDEVV